MKKQRRTKSPEKNRRKLNPTNQPLSYGDISVFQEMLLWFYLIRNSETIRPTATYDDGVRGLLDLVTWLYDIGQPIIELADSEIGSITDRTYWIDENGRPPKLGTVISFNNLKEGKWWPRQKDQERSAVKYVDYLERRGERLTISQHTKGRNLNTITLLTR